MARRKRGRPVHGWLILDKPAGVSSAAAVAKAKWMLDARKAGHAGTLDPAATGLLAIAFGEATKTVAHVMDGEKTYRFVVRWGASTSTDDAEGEVTATSQARPDEAAIRAALNDFRGDIMQVPPQVSAVKIDGQRAYARVRDGETVVIEPRPLHVSRLELVECPDADTAVFEMTCGKGGYVRSIGRDLGGTLGCLGHILSLRRLRSGRFSLDQAIDWERLTGAERGSDLERDLVSVEDGLADLPVVDCLPGEVERLRNGNPVMVLPGAEPAEDQPVWIRHAGRAMGLGRVSGGRFHPERILVSEPGA